MSAFDSALVDTALVAAKVISWNCGFEVTCQRDHLAIDESRHDFRSNFVQVAIDGSPTFMSALRSKMQSKKLSASTRLHVDSNFLRYPS